MMQLWDDMIDKGGFEDGARIPQEARLLRYVYVKAVNAFARKNKSAVRAVSYNRPGVHNSCLIAFVTKDSLGHLVETDILGGVTLLDGMQEATPDPAFWEAVDAANDIDLDACVTVETKVALNVANHGAVMAEIERI